MTADDVVTGVSPALLCYCFADRLVPTSRMKMTGISVPCRDVAVKADELAGTLFAVSFWNLAREGLVKLELVQKKRLGLFSSTSVVATPTGQTARGGLEGVVLANLGGSGKSVRDVIRDWYRQDVLHPAQYVVDVVRREGVAAGYLLEVDSERGRVGAALLGKTKIEPACERITALEGSFSTVSSEWGLYQANQPMLAKALLQECSTAVASRRDTSTTTDNV